MTNQAARPESFARSVSSRIAFHVAGLVACFGAFVVSAFLFILVTFDSAACAPDTGKATEQHVGLILLAVLMTSVPAGWTWLAHRQRLAWWPWSVASVVCAIVVANIVSGSYNDFGCPFTF